MGKIEKQVSVWVGNFPQKTVNAYLPSENRNEIVLRIFEFILSLLQFKKFRWVRKELIFDLGVIYNSQALSIFFKIDLIIKIK